MPWPLSLFDRKRERVIILVGEIDVYVDGKNVISVGGLVFREDVESKVKGMHFQTFFGGTSTLFVSYPSPYDKAEVSLFI